MNIKSEDPATYASSKGLSNDDIKKVEAAKAILERRILSLSDAMTCPRAISDYLILECSALSYEVFGCVYLNSRNQVIKIDQLFRGTIDGASVYPREVVKGVLDHGAASVMFYHNHPSGTTDPSQADIKITDRLKDALKLIDVSVLDHIIVGGVETCSFAERGLI